MRSSVRSLVWSLAVSFLVPLAATRARAEEPAPAPAESMMRKPKITIPAGTAPPTTLVITDRQLGDGAEAVAGKTVVVHYVGVSWSSGKQFDASWDRGQTFEFPLGAGRVIKGWDQGVAGMKVGGRRQLVIPPDLAYGKRAMGDVIKANDTLVFVVDLLRVK